MLHYTKVRRRIATGTNPGVKFLAVISRNGIMTQEQLIERIAGASALAENDVLSALRALQMVITDATMNGITVQLDQLGCFTPYLSAKAMDTNEEVDTSTIRRVAIRFNPNVRFKSKLKTTSYEYRNPAPKGLVDENSGEEIIP
jgi:predicted histone-like DNA-binding protein